jgi:hypothetical protein
MSQPSSLSAFRPPSTRTKSAGRPGLLVAILVLLLAGAAAWILPQRSLLPLETALRADGDPGSRPGTGQ